MQHPIAASWLSSFVVLTLGFAASASTLDSSLYPLTVHYEEEAQAVYARSVLSAVEDAWSFQVDEMGFPAPPADSGLYGSDRYDVFVAEDPYGSRCHREAPAADRPYGFTSSMIVDPIQIPVWALGLVLSHEFHHAVQAGIRPMGDNVMEGGAVYVSGMHRPDEAYILSYSLGINAFQEHPERSLDWQGALGDYYPYGAALFFIFLDEVYGDPKTLAIYKSMWDLLGVSDTLTYSDALSELVDFDSAAAKFSRWRYFVGPEDDGFHFEDLANWTIAGYDQDLTSVALAADLKSENLPVNDSILSRQGPMPYGTVYLRLSLVGLNADDAISISVFGDPATRWRLETLRLKSGRAPDESDLQVDASGQTAVTVGVDDYSTLVVAVQNVGDGTYVPGPNGSGWDPSALTYALRVMHPTESEESNSGCQSAGHPLTSALASLAVWGALVCWRRRPGSRRQTNDQSTTPVEIPCSVPQERQD